MLLSIDELMQSLRSALGPEAVAAASDVLDAHRIDGATPRLVVTPESAQQVATILRLCADARAIVIPWGGGTALALGNPPPQAGVVIKLHKLNGVIEHDAANLTVSARCGTSLNALQVALAERKQFVPVDAPYPERATIGGIIAANLSGPRRGCYGGVRDLVIGMKVVLANGEQIKAGGKVVKNVAGYDLCKLFVGSLGTLGLITEVTLRVAPLPESMGTFIGSGDLTRLENFCEQLLRSNLLPAAIFLARDGPSKQYRIAVWCEGFHESVRRQLDDLGAMAQRSGISSANLTAEKHDELWRPLRDFPLQLKCLIYRITVPPAQVLELIKLTEGWASVAIASDMIMGTIWLACAPQESGRERFAQLSEMARERRGHAVIFTAPSALKSGINVWGESAPTLSLMQAIKNQFDPHGLLNPGRFVGNL
jgi:glycolate oxidase FAD binding subunit